MYKKELEKRLDGTYTRLLMRVQNMSWKNHPTKAEIYGEIPPISVTVAQRRARFAGHCLRAKDQMISDVYTLEATMPNEREETTYLPRYHYKGHWHQI